MAPEFKEVCFQECLSILENKLSSYKKELDLLKETSEGEQKSSMGDKYETTTEMLAQEKRKINEQLSIISKQKQTLINLKATTSSEKIKQGNLITTDKGYFYISISLGKINVYQKDVFVLSPISPLGKLLLNRSKGESIQLNSNSFNILEIN